MKLIVFSPAGVFQPKTRTYLTHWREKSIHSSDCNWCCQSKRNTSKITFVSPIDSISDDSRGSNLRKPVRYTVSKSNSARLGFSDIWLASLESLLVRGIDDGFTVTLSNFVEQQGHEDFPRLRYLEIVEPEEFANPCLDNTGLSGDSQKSWPATRARFVDMCQEVGIRYKIWSEPAESWANVGKNCMDWPEAVRAHFSAAVNKMRF